MSLNILLHTQTFDCVIDNTKTTQYQDRLQYQILYSRIILLSFTFVVVSLELNAIFKLCLIDIVFFFYFAEVGYIFYCV